MHLCRRTLEQPAATARKQGVAAKQSPRRIKGDVGTGMSRNLEHRKINIEASQREALIFSEPHADFGNAFVVRPINRYRPMTQQFGIAADVIGVVMSVQYR